MILPITVYGHPTLKKVAKDIDKDYPELNTLIENMFDTMNNTGHGIGLAAPQINKSIRLFVIDARDLEDHFPEAKDFKKVFINAKITEYGDETDVIEEGCLSIPGLGEDVERPTKIKITYMNENWEQQEEVFEGYLARVVQHEYDHIEGKVYVDRIAPLRKMLIKKKLRNISLGKINPGYRIITPQIRKK
ncbi:MAG: peptide deformylase [Bacteroidales bacterium]